MARTFEVEKREGKYCVILNTRSDIICHDEQEMTSEMVASALNAALDDSIAEVIFNLVWPIVKRRLCDS